MPFKRSVYGKTILKQGILDGIRRFEPGYGTNPEAPRPYR
jgi:hypothetical protein